MALVACNRTPKGIIPDQKMKQILVDIQLAEAMIQTEPSVYPTYEERRALYRTIFDKHHVTEAAYDSSMIWYGKHLEQYMRIFESALVDIKRQIEIIGDIKPDAAPASNADSLDIWMQHKYYVFSPRSHVNRIIIFDLQPDEAYSSGSTFVLGLEVWGMAAHAGDVLEARLCAAQDDTTLFVRSAVAHDGYHSLQLKTLAVKQVKRVYGYLRLNVSDTTFHKIYVDRLNLMKYRYGSSALAPTDSLTIAP
ncbi:MAG: DUF4296 domain-containing protein [Tannerella sp.]|nr:DUF4296 domain-containing protein [Tannerella sp.]